MKPKDMVFMLPAVAILMGAGYLAYTQLGGGKKKANVVQYEVVGTISPDFDQNALSALHDTTKNTDFTVILDTTHLNNPAPFGQ